MNALFQHPWPEDLPSSCPRCGCHFATQRNLSVNIGKAGRYFRHLAERFLFPWIFLSFFVIALRMAGSVYHHTEDPSLTAVICIFVVPSLIFVPLCLFMPNSRRVRCHKCTFDHDYPCRRK